MFSQLGSVAMMVSEKNVVARPLERVAATESKNRRMIERQVHVDALARLERDAICDEAAREAEVERLQAVHSDLKRQAREAGLRLNEALARITVARAAFSQLHALHAGALLDSADPAIAEFLASMAAERDDMQEACRGFRNGRRIDFTAVNARIAAINDPRASRGSSSKSAS